MFHDHKGRLHQGTGKIRVVMCSQAEDKPQASLHLTESPRWQHSDTLGEEGFVDGDELRHVHHRIPGESSRACLTQHIAWGSCQPQIRRDDRDDHRVNTTRIELVGLHDKHGPTCPWSGFRRLRERSPPHLSSTHYHFSGGSESAWSRASTGSSHESSTA